MDKHDQKWLAVRAHIYTHDQKWLAVDTHTQTHAHTHVSHTHVSHKHIHMCHTHGQVGFLGWGAISGLISVLVD